MTPRLAPNETALPVPDGCTSEYAWDGYYRVIYFGDAGRVQVGTAGDMTEAIRVAQQHRDGMARAIMTGRPG